MRIAVGSAGGRAAARRLPATAVLNKARKTKIRFIALYACAGRKNLEAQSEAPKEMAYPDRTAHGAL
jgi:hypothetical protein